MKNLWLGLLLAVAAVTMSAYFFVRPTVDSENIPTVLRVGVLPDEAGSFLSQRYTPLLEYLSETTGLETRLVIPTDYAELVQLFGNKELELAFFGGLTFVQAYSAYDAEPLVMREVDARFTSWFLVRGSDSAQSLSDLKGRKFSFGSKLSTSGHLMPRHFLDSHYQVSPEELFSGVQYSGGHDNTAYLVRDGAVDLGVANSQIIKQMVADGRLRKNDLRVLWETPPYVDYTWAVHSALNEGIKTRLRDAFLGLNTGDAVQGEILARMGAKVFLPAGVNDFEMLTRVVKDLGMLERELP